MICPRCGHENPDTELFCEECDFRMDQKYRPVRLSKEDKGVYFSFAGLVLGLAGIVSILLKNGIFGIVFGVLGLFISSYAMGIVRFIDIKKNIKMLLLAIVVTGMLTSIFGLMFGLKYQFM